MVANTTPEPAASSPDSKQPPSRVAHTTMRRVRDVMTADPAVVERTTTFKDIVALLDQQGVSAAVVVGPGKRVIGIVSETDLIAAVAVRPASRLSRWLRRPQRQHFGATAVTAERLMTADPITVTPDDTLAETAALADRIDVRQLPVVSGASQRLCGMVTRQQMLREFLRRDAAIKKDIIDQVLEGEFSLEPGTVQVSVLHGVAMLTGQLERGELTDDVARAVAAVPGVVDVDCLLTHAATPPHTHATPAITQATSHLRPG